MKKYIHVITAKPEVYALIQSLAEHGIAFTPISPSIIRMYVLPKVNVWFTSADNPKLIKPEGVKNSMWFVKLFNTDIDFEVKKSYKNRSYRIVITIEEDD